MGSEHRVLLIDNYDSFTWNVVQGLGRLGAEVTVHRNDALDVAAALSLAPTHLVLSPGPGRPEDAGLCLGLLAAAPESLPVLGVCLGHQAMALALGGHIVPARRLVHGKSSPIRHDGSRLFEGLPSPLQVGRYHSLAVHGSELPETLRVDAVTDDADEELMAISHVSRPWAGVQFHPESVLTPEGQRIFANFLGFSA